MLYYTDVFFVLAIIAAALGFGVQPLWICLAVGFGLSAYPLYGVLVAHMNDHVDRDGFVEASGGMLLLWGLGASTGPLLASAAMAPARARPEIAAIANRSGRRMKASVVGPNSEHQRG